MDELRPWLALEDKGVPDNEVPLVDPRRDGDGLAFRCSIDLGLEFLKRYRPGSRSDAQPENQNEKALHSST